MGACEVVNTVLKISASFWNLPKGDALLSVLLLLVDVHVLDAWEFFSSRFCSPGRNQFLRKSWFQLPTCSHGLHVQRDAVFFFSKWWFWNHQDNSSRKEEQGGGQRWGLGMHGRALSFISFCVSDNVLSAEAHWGSCGKCYGCQHRYQFTFTFFFAYGWDRKKTQWACWWNQYAFMLTQHHSLVWTVYLSTSTIQEILMKDYPDERHSSLKTIFSETFHFIFPWK